MGIETKLGIAPKLRDYLSAISSALSGDIVMTITPATTTRVATAATWTRKVLVTFKDSKGRVHEWLNTTMATKVTAADTSTAGAASVGSANLVVVNGIAEITVTGTAAAWVAGQTNTVTIANCTVLGVTVAGGTSVETIVAA